jgi:Protein of unknown function (DUF3617)
MIAVKPTTTFALICLALAGAAWLHAEERMRAGLWEVISTFNGTPSGTAGNTCYTPAMVAVGNAPATEVKQAAEKLSTAQGCTIREFTMDGNKMSMTKVCGAKTSVIVSTYSGDRFETVDTATKGGVTSVMRMTGKRVSECK